MKGIAIGLLAMSMCGAAALAAETKAKAADAETTISGEVLDLACYMGHEGKGDKHASCAKKCLEGGAPAGIMTKDGKVFVLVNDHQAEAAYQSLKDYAGAQAKITGKMAKRGGLQGFIVLKVEKAS